jgi:hypothetical protein
MDFAGWINEGQIQEEEEENSRIYTDLVSRKLLDGPRMT